MTSQWIGNCLGREFTGTDFRWLYNEGGWPPNMIWFAGKQSPDYWPEGARTPTATKPT